MKHLMDEPTIQNYLSAIESRLVNLPPEQAEEILFGIREHIIHALSRNGSSVSEVLSQLGNPDDVLAEMAGAEAPDITTVPHRSSRL